MTPFFFFFPQRPDVSVEHFYTSARLCTRPRCFGEVEDAFGKLMSLPDGERGERNHGKKFWEMKECDSVFFFRFRPQLQTNFRLPDLGPPLWSSVLALALATLHTLPWMNSLTGASDGVLSICEASCRAACQR